MSSTNLIRDSATNRELNCKKSDGTVAIIMKKVKKFKFNGTIFMFIMFFFIVKDSNLNFKKNTEIILRFRNKNVLCM